MNQEQLNTARAASFVALTNAVTLVAEVVRQTVGNDAADPDVNKKVMPLGLEDAVAARLNSRLETKEPVGSNASEGAQ